MVTPRVFHLLNVSTHLFKMLLGLNETSGCLLGAFLNLNSIFLGLFQVKVGFVKLLDSRPCLKIYKNKSIQTTRETDWENFEMIFEVEQRIA